MTDSAPAMPEHTDPHSTAPNPHERDRTMTSDPALGKAVVSLNTGLEDTETVTVAFLVVMFSQVKYHQTIALVLFVCLPLLLALVAAGWLGASARRGQA